MLEGLTSTPLHYSRGKNTYDNSPAQLATDDFDTFEDVVLADRAPRKGLAFICAPLAHGLHYQKPDDYPGIDKWRLKDHVESRLFIAFDFDGFKDVAAFQATLAYLRRYRGFGYTTASHSTEAPRARAILKLSRPVSRDEGITLGEALQAAMLLALGPDAIKFDGSVYRGEQPIYTPVTTSETFHFHGDDVDVDALLERCAIAARQPVPVGGATAALAAGLGFNWPAKIVDGEGRESFILSAAGHLRSKGIGQAMIESILLDYNRAHITPPLDEAVVLKRAQHYATAEPIQAANDADWPDPSPLDETLPLVPPFPLKLLPNMLGAYVQDVAERLSCPVDFPAIAAMVALAVAMGSRIHCKPYDKGTWMVPAGAWGMVVSPASAIKSPALSEMLQPLYEMDKRAAEQYRIESEQYQISKQIYEKAVKTAVSNSTLNVGVSAPVEPKMTRYVVNDSTYEMLVAIAAANPTGFLILRDELIGWFHSLNKENQKEARGLYLTGWSGTEGYATDRIGRGHLRADRVNLSLLGTIQPNVLRQIVYDAVAGGAGDDGLVARFQLAVYPDPIRKFVKVDRSPDLIAMRHYKDLILRLVTLDPKAVGASFTFDDVAYLPFDEEAQQIFDDWRQALEDRIRAADSEEHPAMLAHLGKYRSLFPKLALILHLADGGIGPIGKNPALRAQVWTKYLEAHARRIYHTATNRTMQSAVALAKKIKAGRLDEGFTKTDVLVKEWAGLRTAEEVGTALTVLRDGSWLRVTEDRRTGGRPAERHYMNPKVKRVA
ncbi:MAG: DUF3987 domain-containing protein [Comamonadaceae bacterium]|nr:MAG: DUF3987 domain-containing protein [Comamonadaceae bacterium]